MIPCAPIPTWPESHDHYAIWGAVNDRNEIITMIFVTNDESFIQLDVRSDGRYRWRAFSYSRNVANKITDALYLRWFRKLYPSAQLDEDGILELSAADDVLLRMQVEWP